MALTIGMTWPVPELLTDVQVAHWFNVHIATTLLLFWIASILLGQPASGKLSSINPIFVALSSRKIPYFFYKSFRRLLSSCEVKKL